MRIEATVVLSHLGADFMLTPLFLGFHFLLSQLN